MSFEWTFERAGNPYANGAVKFWTEFDEPPGRYGDERWAKDVGLLHEKSLLDNENRDCEPRLERLATRALVAAMIERSVSAAKWLETAYERVPDCFVDVLFDHCTEIPAVVMKRLRENAPKKGPVSNRPRLMRHLLERQVLTVRAVFRDLRTIGVRRLDRWVLKYPPLWQACVFFSLWHGLCKEPRNWLWFARETRLDFDPFDFRQLVEANVRGDPFAVMLLRSYPTALLGRVALAGTRNAIATAAANALCLPWTHMMNDMKRCEVCFDRSLARVRPGSCTQVCAFVYVMSERNSTRENARLLRVFLQSPRNWCHDCGKSLLRVVVPRGCS